MKIIYFYNKSIKNIKIKIYKEKIKYKFIKIINNKFIVNFFLYSI